MQKIIPCIAFASQAEDAMKYYLSIFPRSKIVNELRYTGDGPMPRGTFLGATIELDGSEFMLLNGPDEKPSLATSFFIKCKTQEEIDHYWNALLAGGQPIQCGWLKDKYGVAWQIAPEELPSMLKDKDSAKATRVMDAMCRMVKLDWPALQRAYDGK
ncbi:MAG: VOC family protein [Planctomycetes bacterium]|nr:VOC family protein [Planctomycetota bacterium]